MSRPANRHHLAWDAQPLLRPATRRPSHPSWMVVGAFALGVLIGLLV
jgi:demethoxyubiquinone hydroxylase (CLK1/Coq7/Cat5 family)